ncbi:MAG: pore-forming ESAT-6 family protein [Erysipelotrichaceae bacterium]|nr:pore-forming ESAT-6 family protein [Erysipelotrichaceae bacterium]
MNNIRITLAQVSECAESIRTQNRILMEQLQMIKKDMNDLSATWQSDSSETIRMKFNQFALRFEVQKDIIDSYAKFLDFTVSSYDTLESSINANAAGFNA